MIRQRQSVQRSGMQSWVRMSVLRYLGLLLSGVAGGSPMDLEYPLAYDVSHDLVMARTRTCVYDDMVESRPSPSATEQVVSKAAAQAPQRPTSHASR